MQQVVPNAIRVDTATYALCVPTMVAESDDNEMVYTYLVTAWVFTAYLMKRFPDADAMDAGMLASLAAARKDFLSMAKHMTKNFPKHPKTKQNTAMLECLHEAFNVVQDVTKAQFDEIKSYNEQAMIEVNNLFPCTCGECPGDAKN